MVWVVQLEEIIEGNTVRRAKVATLDRSAKLNSLDELGLRLVEAKALLANIQAEITTGQIERDAESRRVCPDCGKRRHIKDYRSRRFDTFFGRIEVRIPRFVCPEHGLGGAHNGGVAVLSARSTPEYDATRAKLAAQLPYRVAADLLASLLPVSAGATHTTIRNQTFCIAEKIAAEAAMRQPVQAVPALTVQLDHAYIRAVASEASRHLFVLVGNIEAEGQTPKRRFASLAEHNACSPIVREHLRCSGCGPDTALTALTDGDEGLRNIARAAALGSAEVILDWFHLAMRLRPVEQIAQGLRPQLPTHVAAKTKIVDALDHLHWRLWHGKLNTLAECFEQVRSAMRALRRRNKGQRLHGPARTLMSRLQELEQYIANNTGTLVNYHRRQRAGLRVSSCGVESSVNCLINRRMNKSQQMRWSRQGAELLLRVRAALLNGEFDALARAHECAQAANDDDFRSLPLAA